MMLHTKYQGFRPYGFRLGDFFHVYPILAYAKHLNPRVGHLWPQGYNLIKLGRGPLVDASYQISRL